MHAIAVLAALTLGTTQPGSLIAVNASCSYSIAGTTPASANSTGFIGVLAPLRGTNPRPVFLQRYYRKIRTETGSTYTRPETIANGLLVRFLKRTADGQYAVLEGIQLSDGRVLVDGTLVPRDE